MTNVFIDRRGTIYIYRTHACWACRENSETNEQFRWQEYTVFESYSGMYIWKERETRRKRLLLGIPELFSREIIVSVRKASH